MLSQRVPAWLGAVVGLLAVMLTLFADRVSVAGQVSALTVRVESVEAQCQEIEAQHQAMMDKLDANGAKLDTLKVTVQQIEDRQDEVRRRMGIVR